MGPPRFPLGPLGRPLNLSGPVVVRRWYVCCFHSEFCRTTGRRSLRICFTHDFRDIVRRSQALSWVIPMARPRKCQRCNAHSSAFRRMCVMCQRWVGPGCYPERCLEMDADWGDADNVCRDCWSSYGPAPVSHGFRRLWRIIRRQGFFGSHDGDVASSGD